jgi:hypothetical protein
LRGAAATWQSKKNAANNGYERANFGVRNDNSLHKSLFFNAKVKNGLILDAVRHCERPTGAWQSTTFPSLQETVIHFFFPSLRGAIATWQSKEIFEKINRFISFITIKNLRFFDNIKRFALFHDTSCLAMTKEKLSPQTKRGGFFLRAEMPSQISEKTDCHNTSCLAMTEKKSDKVGKERCGEYDKKTATDFGETDKDELKVSSIREVCKPRVKTNSHSNKENR